MSGLARPTGSTRRLRAHYNNFSMVTIRSLGTAEALRAIDAIRDEMARRGEAGVIAVADAQGELIALLRLDGAPLASIVIAANKAWTAARERRPTADIGQAARDPHAGFDIGNYGDMRYTGWGGGVPVAVGGSIVGAVAVSGLPEGADVELAALGAKAITDNSSL